MPVRLLQKSVRIGRHVGRTYDLNESIFSNTLLPSSSGSPHRTRTTGNSYDIWISFDGWKEAKRDRTCNDFVGIVKLLSSPASCLDIKTQETPISLAKYLHLLPFLPSLLLRREMGRKYAVWGKITTVPRVFFVSRWRGSLAFKSSFQIDSMYGILSSSVRMVWIWSRFRTSAHPTVQDDCLV